ncbi:MAG TPA: hypothetical protein VG326_08390 [Tepidisphaeraceae bacterium]|jgi:hypothetical protein|nr:hypothetical protein [Tepidisphaeraceae bacterium]
MIFVAQQPAPPFDMLSTALGVAAILLVIGWSITRWQRDRERFALMQTALEKGVTRFPGTPPYWLVSLRQGVTLSAVGVGLMIAGGGAWWLGRGVPMANTVAESTVAPASPSQNPPDRDLDHSPPPEAPPPFDPENRGPGHRGPSPREDGPPESHPPHGDRLRGDQSPHGQSRPDRMLHDQQHERWHQAQAQQTIGLVSAATGLILLLVGVVRVGFAKVEQRFAAESDDATAYS